MASHYHVGDCVTTRKDDKIVPEKIKNLIKIFSKKRGKKHVFVFLKINFYIGRQW